jgi:hypothetical protein
MRNFMLKNYAKFLKHTLNCKDSSANQSFTKKKLVFEFKF